jgi:endonuclease III
LFLARLRGIGELVDMLYRDPATGKQKSGAVDSHVIRAGNLSNRLPARIRQLEVTHDLTNLTAEQLLKLLGDEFRQWAVVATAPSNRRRRSSPTAPPASP